jgi:hypothetical protein
MSLLSSKSVSGYLDECGADFDRQLLETRDALAYLGPRLEGLSGKCRASLDSVLTTLNRFAW